MYVAAPPPMAGQGRGTTLTVPLRLVGGYRRTFTTPGGDSEARSELIAGIEQYLRDLVAGYGVGYRPELLRQGVTPFSAMAARLLADLGPVDPPVDLIVLSHATADVDPRTSPACFLVDAAPGAPTAFSLSEQGRVAPFTALRVAGTYADGGPFAQVLVMALDQRTVPWEVPPDTPLPTVDAAVALRLEHVGADRAGVRLQEHTGVTPDRMPDVLAAHLGELTAGDLPVRLLAGRGLPPGSADGLGVPVTEGGAGPLCTSVWELLAAAAAAHGPGAAAIRVVVADYDAALGYLCLAAIDLDAA